MTECNLAAQDTSTADTCAKTSSITDQIQVDDILLHHADMFVDLPTGQLNGIDP